MELGVLVCIHSIDGDMFILCQTLICIIIALLHLGNDCYRVSYVSYKLHLFILVNKQ